MCGQMERTAAIQARSVWLVESTFLHHAMPPEVRAAIADHRGNISNERQKMKTTGKKAVEKALEQLTKNNVPACKKWLLRALDLKEVEPEKKCSYRWKSPL